MNELINDEAVYRTAPATPGLLKVIIIFFLNLLVLFWYWCYYLHRGRDLMSPVCGIFPHFQLLADMVFQWLSFKQCSVAIDSVIESLFHPLTKKSLKHLHPPPTFYQ